MTNRRSLFRGSAYSFGIAVGILTAWIAFSFVMVFLNDGWAEIRYEPDPRRYYAPWVLSVTTVMVGLTGIALAGLIASALWRVVRIGAERAREAPLGSLAQRTAGLLTSGSTRAEVEQQLATEGLGKGRIDEVLTLGWPFGARCPQCGQELRPFTFINHHTGRSVYHCTACEWSGELPSG